ncbi:Protein CBG02233 [Caenorhabditis briggsae]|nr:Protein CBG02233 [Caenorhabditis briggsae]CAP23338.2 Protein CBG02233 [Caenorhabditis briggsae]
MKYSIFTVSITISLHLIMISFIVTYVFLVSGGFSIIDSLLQKEGAKPMSFSIIRKRWNQYLAVRRNDPIIRVLFVSSD